MPYISTDPLLLKPFNTSLRSHLCYCQIEFNRYLHTVANTNAVLLYRKYLP